MQKRTKGKIRQKSYTRNNAMLRFGRSVVKIIGMNVLEEKFQRFWGILRF